MNPNFRSMTADLRARGLIDSAHRLTPEGNAHVDALLMTLRETRAVKASVDKRVRWRTGREIN